MISPTPCPHKGSAQSAQPAAAGWGIPLAANTCSAMLRGVIEWPRAEGTAGAVAAHLVKGMVRHG